MIQVNVISTSNVYHRTRSQNQKRRYEDKSISNRGMQNRSDLEVNAKKERYLKSEFRWTYRNTYVLKKGNRNQNETEDDRV